MIKEFEEYFNVVKSEVSTLLLMYGEVPLTGVLLKQNLEPLIIPLYMLEKEQVGNTISNIVEDTSADAIIIFFEAWYVEQQLEKDEEVPNIIPSQHKNRKECIMILYKDKEFTEDSKILPFIRNNKEISFQDMIDMSSDTAYNKFLSKVFVKKLN